MEAMPLGEVLIAGGGHCELNRLWKCRNSGILIFLVFVTLLVVAGRWLDLWNAQIRTSDLCSWRCFYVVQDSKRN